MLMIAEQEAWAAFERRDRSWDGRVIGATTSGTAASDALAAGGKADALVVASPPPLAFRRASIRVQRVRNASSRSSVGRNTMPAATEPAAGKSA